MEVRPKPNPSLDCSQFRATVEETLNELRAFETAIIERYRRRESSVALWRTRVSPGTVPNLNQKIICS